MRESLIAGQYLLTEQVGRGGFAVVWRARDERLHRDVAAKQLFLPPYFTDAQRREHRARTLREARSAARLAHPGIVTVYDVVEHDGIPWIIMEFVQGRTLGQIVRTDGPLTPARAAAIGLWLLSALRTAHAAGVLHRDVKPSNVIVGDDRVVLGDFGIARIEGDDELTESGIVMGAPSYTAPERARGEPAVPASDLWSLGATLFYAVEGRRAFHGPNANATFHAILTSAPAPTHRAGPLAPIIEGLLRKDATDRLSPAEATELLTACAHGLPPHRNLDRTNDRPARRERRRRKAGAPWSVPGPEPADPGPAGTGSAGPGPRGGAADAESRGGPTGAGPAGPGPRDGAVGTEPADTEPADAGLRGSGSAGAEAWGGGPENGGLRDGGPANGRLRGREPWVVHDDGDRRDPWTDRQEATRPTLDVPLAPSEGPANNDLPHSARPAAPLPPPSPLSPSAEVGRSPSSSPSVSPPPQDLPSPIAGWTGESWLAGSAHGRSGPTAGGDPVRRRRGAAELPEISAAPDTDGTPEVSGRHPASGSRLSRQWRRRPAADPPTSPRGRGPVQGLPAGRGRGGTASGLPSALGRRGTANDLPSARRRGGPADDPLAARGGRRPAAGRVAGGPVTRGARRRGHGSFPGLEERSRRRHSVVVVGSLTTLVFVLLSNAPPVDDPRRRPAASYRAPVARPRLTATLPAGRGEVFSVAFSPDGRTLATGGQDRTVRLWNVAGHRPAGTLAGHRNPVATTAFSPDGRTLATGAYDGKVILWNATGHRAIATLDTHGHGVGAVTFSADGAVLATAGDSVRLWNVAGHRGLRSLPTSGEYLLTAAFGPHGHTLATAGTRAVRLWDVTRRTRPATVTRLTSMVDGMAFSPNGKMLATGGDDRSVRLWDVGGHRLLATVPRFGGRVNAVAFSPDGHTLACASGAAVLLWNTTTGSTAARLDARTRTVESVAFSPDGRTLATAGDDAAVRLWELG